MVLDLRQQKFLGTNFSQASKLKLGFTLGDLGGIGPEIFEKFKRQHQHSEDIEIILIDDLNSVKKLDSKIKLGQASAYSGEHAYRTLIQADQMLKNKEIDYLITGPVAKESFWMSGIQCTGQTELLAQINELSRDEIEMFFIYEQFRVVLATRHIPIKDVPKVLEERLESVITNSFKALKEVFRINNPKIALAGLNPHAGENGIIGLEEKQFIKPLVEKNKEFMDINGPFPADTLLTKVAQAFIQNGGKMGELDYDLFISAYHDQVLPLIKGIGGLRAINLTVGLPYIRLSVDHGTGFDIAGKGIASAESFHACTNFKKL